MYKENMLYDEISNGEETELVFDKLCFGDVVYLHKDFKNMLNDIEIAIELDNRKVFLEGMQNSMM